MSAYFRAQNPDICTKNIYPLSHFVVVLCKQNQSYRENTFRRGPCFQLSSCLAIHKEDAVKDGWGGRGWTTGNKRGNLQIYLLYGITTRRTGYYITHTHITHYSKQTLHSDLSPSLLPTLSSCHRINNKQNGQRLFTKIISLHFYFLFPNQISLS